MGGGVCCLIYFLFCSLSPVQQTASGIGHRVSVFGLATNTLNVRNNFMPRRSRRILICTTYDIIRSIIISMVLAGANPAVNIPRPSRGTRIESCDFIVLVSDP